MKQAQRKAMLENCNSGAARTATFIASAPCMEMGDGMRVYKDRY